MKPILLHICCGVCAAGVVTKLREDGFEPTGFYYNPNIHPQDEYERRLSVVKAAATLLNFDLITGPYENNLWRQLIKGWEQEPEGGKRCSICFRLRLAKTLEKARELGLANFTSTLSVSPHKNVDVINALGKELGEGFQSYDFKKEDGFKKTMEFAKTHDFYRQHYCGCEYSMKEAR